MNRSGLILLGGKGSRAGYRAKYLFEYEGETFLSRQIRTLSHVTDEIIISCRDQKQVEDIPDYDRYVIVTDEKRGHGPAEGIRTGIQAARGDLIFIAACDMPLISEEIIVYLFSRIGDFDAAIPEWESGFQEPLCAVYRRKALLYYFSHGYAHRLSDITKTLQAIAVPVDDLKKMDPLLLSFTNINNLNEYEKLIKKEE